MQIYPLAGKTAILLLSTLPFLTNPALAQTQESDNDNGWFARAWGGYSSLSDTSGSAASFEGGSGSVDVSLDGGFTAGLGAGYRYNKRLAVELAWEYRSNDSETSFADGAIFNEGNYASNAFFLNGYYFLDRRGSWEPYVGAGLIWLQEVDIDLEGNGPEQSFSADGDTGLQVFVGTNYRINDRWQAHGELRYGSVTGIDLTGENTEGTLSDFDYEPLTLQLGVSYSF